MTRAALLDAIARLSTDLASARDEERRAYHADVDPNDVYRWHAASDRLDALSILQRALLRRLRKTARRLKA